MERLFRSVGNDLFDVILDMSSQTDQNGKKPSSIGQWLLEGTRLLSCLGYCFAHSMLFLFQVLLLNIALNSPGDSAMFLLIVTNNFGELKSTVFKKYRIWTSLMMFDGNLYEGL